MVEGLINARKTLGLHPKDMLKVLKIICKEFAVQIKISENMNKN